MLQGDLKKTHHAMLFNAYGKIISYINILLGNDNIGLWPYASWKWQIDLWVYVSKKWQHRFVSGEAVKKWRQKRAFKEVTAGCKKKQRGIASSGDIYRLALAVRESVGIRFLVPRY